MKKGASNSTPAKAAKATSRTRVASAKEDRKASHVTPATDSVQPVDTTSPIKSSMKKRKQVSQHTR